MALNARFPAGMSRSFILVYTGEVFERPKRHKQPPGIEQRLYQHLLLQYLDFIPDSCRLLKFEIFRIAVHLIFHLL